MKNMKNSGKKKRTARNFTCLTLEDRRKIQEGLEENMSTREIAEWIGKHQSTVYREIKRGKENGLHKVDNYSPDKAQEKYEENKRKGGVVMKIKDDPELLEWIGCRIKKDKMSPAAICNLLRNDTSLNFDHKINSKATIYSYLRKGKIPNASLDDLPYNKGNRTITKDENRKNHSIDHSIEDRPEVVSKRTEFGHWEAGTLVNENCEKGLLVLIEKKTKYVILESLNHQTSEEVVVAFKKLNNKGIMRSLPFKTITVHNGEQFKNTKQIKNELDKINKDIKIYSAHSYGAWERGQCENAKKLIRRKIKNDEDLNKTLNDGRVKDIQDWVNNYPRDKDGGVTARDKVVEEVKKLL